MLELIRGKRVVFAGDSINRNQWESMLCLLMGAVKDPSKVYETRGRRITKTKGAYSFRFVVSLVLRLSNRAPNHKIFCAHHLVLHCRIISVQLSSM